MRCLPRASEIPRGSSLLAYFSAFSYQVPTLGASLPDAVTGAGALGGDTELFRLWT
ncbi:hypothetical protein ABZ686_18035 [Streptomyces sp. NPDC006992]|uniref:hypothetical protein n=1 Tax=Streptomyces sp. NPDC006992 TaxID=3155601 RepID=UPI0033C0FC16